MFSFNLGGFDPEDMKPREYRYEITTDGQVQTGVLNTLPIMAQQELASLVDQMRQDRRPCRVKFTQHAQIWSQIDQKWITREVSIEYSNFAEVYKEKVD